VSRVRISVEDPITGGIDVDLEAHDYGRSVVDQLLDKAAAKVRAACGIEKP
jgi:hypothetical protein